MISTQDYRLVTRPGASGLPAGISLDVPILRKRLLREAALPEEAAQLLDLLRTALSLEAEDQAGEGGGGL
ncbi:hypothetical protein ACWCPD_39695 [Streptomyces sp. NPDC001935]